MQKYFIPFNIPLNFGNEIHSLIDCIKNNKLSGDGIYTKKCHEILNHYLMGSQSLLTHSCTAALEMSALLINIQPGDEVIMPSYTFVSTANAFVLFGATPVFIDIRPDTLNIDETLIEQAITPKTKAIVAVHYAGVACDMDKINSIAKKYNLFVIEDAAQGVGSFYKNKPLGTLGDLGAFSFHETKNIISGEGGALIINNSQFNHRAEIIREKGTNRSQFLRGEIDRYTWRDVGSSYLPSELIAAYLYNHLTKIEEITQARLKIWNNYYKLLKPLEDEGLVRCPVLPDYQTHNGHIFYLLLSRRFSRDKVLQNLNQKGIHAISHYEPLHSSPAGKKYGKTIGELTHTNSLAKSIIRLPLWVGLKQEQQEFIAEQMSFILDTVTEQIV